MLQVHSLIQQMFAQYLVCAMVIVLDSNHSREIYALMELTLHSSREERHKHRRITEQINRQKERG